MRLLADAGPPLVSDDDMREWEARLHAAPDPPPIEEVPTPVDPSIQWEEATVRSLLRTQGGILHALLSGGHEEAWIYTKNDLDAIAPPMCRIANRYTFTRALAAAGDEIALVTALGGYGFRSMRQRGQAIAAAEIELEESGYVEPTAAVHPDGSLHEAAPPAPRNLWGMEN